MTGIALFVLMSYWRRHLFQLGALIVGLALATALWSAVQAINAQARTSYAQAAAFLSPTSQTYLKAQSGTLTIEDYVSLKRLGWRVTPVLEGRWRNTVQNIDIIGVDPLTSRRFQAQSAAQPGHGDSVQAAQGLVLAMLQPPGTLLMHPETAGRFGADYPGPTGTLAIRVSDAVPVGLAITDIALASWLLGQPDQLSWLTLMQNETPSAAAIADLPPHIQLVTAPENDLDPGGLTDSFHLNLTAFGFLSFCVGLFIVQGMIALAMEQRRGLVRTLRSLGLPVTRLFGVLALEILFLASISAVIGLILGYFLAATLLPGVSVTLENLYGAGVAGRVSLQPGWILSGFAMSLLGTTVAGAQSFYTLWKLPILQAPSTQARGQQVLGSYGRLALGGGILFCLGALVFFFQGGLIGGFGFLGGLLLGVAMALPFCLWRLLRLGQRYAGTPLAQWLWADAQAQLPGMSLALMALMLALAANIGVGTMVSSFRLTFEDWMDQRLSAELYVTARNEEEGQNLSKWLERRARVLPIRYADLVVQTGPLRIYGVVDDRTYRDAWPMLTSVDGVWDHVAQGKGVLISEQLARRAGLGLGDRLPLPAGWPSRVLGIYADYGNPHGQAIVSMDRLLQQAPGAPNQRFGLRLDPEEVPDLMRDIRQEFDIPRENLIEQKRIKSQSLAVFNQTFQVTDALKLLTLGVASFAILTSLIILWSQRLPQLAPLWAMGITRQKLALLDVLRSLLMAALTAVLALPLGLVLAWVLLSVINAAAFGWRLPMFLFPADWLALVLLSLLAALIAALIPAWKLFRIEPHDLLKVFASER